MFTSIATVSISGTLESKLRAIARAGFHGVEIFENDLLTSQVSARDVGALMRDLGLECTLFQPFRDFEGMPDTLRPRIFERMERKFDVMQELGTDLLLVCSNVSPAASADRSRTVADFRELGERAAKRGLRVGYEALAWGRHVSDHREAWSIVLDVDHPAIGLILDSFHSLARNIPNESLREIDPARIFIVQLADAPVLQMDFLSWSRHFRNMPGQGELPIVDYVATLLEQGYTGPLSLEIFNDRFRSSSATAVALDGHRALNFLYDQVTRRLAPRITPELPPRARVRGVEFVEFAANEGEVELLESLFAALGFSRSGKHRTKDVTRWRQNGINFVINSEPDSFARAYDSMHGASVCALGVSVENVANAMRRAAGQQIEQFSQPLGPGELLIPCVHEFNILYDRDTDGEYFHLVSRAFAKRFFFEVIERRGYQGYGAANTTIRLAAQSRYRDDFDR
jgi:4-hydroxyphenylpyruvate dioxygenase